MSLANTSLHLVLARHNGEHRSWSTSAFCDLLQLAVDFMQKNHKQQSLPPTSIGEVFEHDFIVQLWSAIRAGRYFMLASAVLLLYEHVVTLDLEVELIWMREKWYLHMVPNIFLLTRYIPLATYIFIAIGVHYSGSDHMFCTHIFAHIPPALIVLCEILIGVLGILKTRAIWKHDANPFMAALIIVTFLAKVVLAVACAVALQGVGPLFGRDNRIGCFVIFKKGSMPRLVVHWFINIVFNILIFFSILRKSLSIRIHGNTGRTQNLPTVILRDAIVQFTVMLLVNVANLLMLLLFPYWNAITWSFSNIADVILTSRLLFNVREQMTLSTPTVEDLPDLPPSATKLEVV
ncbi:hypothetical protein BDW22DRAFT_1353232 [Trametopsis cervina]|nr:hypothetical protein BDW22DRAFT_1353232 [Trametopsis cervina]